MALFVWLKGRKEKNSFRGTLTYVTLAFTCICDAWDCDYLSYIETLEIGVKLRPLLVGYYGERIMRCPFHVPSLLVINSLSGYFLLHHTLSQVSSRLFYITLLYNEVTQPYTLQSNQSQQVRREILSLEMK